GLKERTLPRSIEDQLQRQLETRALLERLFGASSELREALRQSDVVDDTLSHGYQGERSFGFALCGCEADDPERTAVALQKALLAAPPLLEEHLERMRRVFLGQYVRSFESARALAFGHCNEALEDVAPFSSVGRVQALTLDMVR